MTEKVELTEQDYADNALLNDAIAYASLRPAQGYDYALHRASAGGYAHCGGYDRRQAPHGCRCAA